MHLTTIPEALRPRVATAAIREYCELSHAYYVHNISLISDGAFDDLCKWLLANYWWISVYDINGYLDQSALESGTGYQLKLKGVTLKAAEERVKSYGKEPRTEKLF